MKINNRIVTSLKAAGYTSAMIDKIVKERESHKDFHINIRTAVEPNFIDILSTDELKNAGIIIKAEEENEIEEFYMEGIE